MIDFSKYKTTSTGIDFSKYTSKEKKPEEVKPIVREVGLPEHLGGGRYLTNDSGDLIKSPRSQSALGDTKEGSERDHIISVALGGVSTRENLQYLATTEEGRQAGKVSVEQKAINDYTSGKISLGEARGLIATKQQQIKGFTPTDKEQTTKGQLIPAIKGLPKTIWGKIQSIGDFIENALPSKGSIIENIAAKSASEVLGREIDPVNYASQIKDLSIEDKQLIQQRTTDSIKESVTGDINVARNVISAIGQSAFSSKFKEQRGEAFKKGTLQSAAALTSTLAKGVETLGMIDFSNKLKSIAEKDLQGVIYINNLKKKGIVVEDNRKFSEKIQDPNFITEGLFQSLPNMLFAMGVGLPALAVSAPGAVVAGTIFGATATLEGGFAYNEAKQQGATEDEATKAASITGIANGILEGLPIFKLFTRNPAIKRLKQSFIKKVVNNIVQQFKRAGSQSLAEGTTESLQEIVSNSAARVYDENRSIFSGADESFFFGALMGGGMSIGMDVIQSTKDLPVGLSLKDVSSEAEAKKLADKARIGTKEFGVRYNDEVKEKVVELYRRGMSSTKIESNTGISSVVVLKWANDAGIKRTISQATILYKKDIPKVIELYKQGKNTTEISKELNLVKSSVARWVKDAGIMRSNSEAQAILAELGKTNVMGVRSKVSTKFGVITADSTYEAIRIKQLEINPDIVSIKRATRIPFGENKHYVPDLEIKYKDGSTVIEEIKPNYKINDEKVLAKQKTAQDFYKDKDIDYRIITENDIGNDAFSNVNIDDFNFGNEEIKSRFVLAIKKAKSATKSELTDIWKKAQEVKPSVSKKKLEIKGIKPELTPLIAKREKTLLKDKLKNLARGYREGAVVTRESIKDIQGALIDVVNISKLDANDKAKFIKTIKNTNTELKLQKELPNFIERIENLESADKIRTIKAEINKELKTTKLLKKSGKPVGKFTPGVQKVMDILRASNKMTKAEAQTKIIENLKKEPTPELALENKLLSLKLQEISPEGYQATLDTIKSIKEKGELTRELQKFNLAQDIDAERKFLEDKIRGNAKEGGQATFGKGKPSKFKQSLKSLGKNFILDWHGMMRVLDFNSSVEDKSLSKRYNTLEQDNKYKELQSQFIEDFKVAISESYDIKDTDNSIHKKLTEMSDDVSLGVVKNADGISKEFIMTRDELIKRWMELQDPTLTDSFYEGNRYTDTIINKINEKITPADKKFAEAQLEMYNNLYKPVNDIYSVIYGVDLPFNEFYSPIRREGYKVNEQEFLGEFLEDVQNRVALTSSSFISRVQNSNPIATQSSINTLNQHFSQMNYFIAWMEKIRFFNSMFKNTEVRDAITDEFGGSFMNALDNSINDITTNGNKNARRYKVVDWFRTHFTIGALALKPAIGIKQLVSTLAYMEVMNPIEFTTGVADFWKNPVKNYKILKNESVFVKTRGGGNMERDIAAAHKSPIFKKFNKKQSFMNTAMLNVTIGDKGAIVMGSWALRRALLKRQGITTPTKEIVREYEGFSSETQQSADISRLSEVQRGGSFEKLFTMFKSSQRQYLQKEVNAIRSLFQKDGTTPKNIKKVAKTIFIYHTLLPVVFQYIANLGGWDDDDKKEYLRASLLGSINGLFIFGDILDSILRQVLELRVWDVNIPLLTVGDDIRKVMSNLSEDDITSEDVMDAIEGLAGAGNSAGIPTEQVLRMGQGISDIMKEDYKRGFAQLLGWSTYFVDGGKSKSNSELDKIWDSGTKTKTLDDIWK